MAEKLRLLEDKERRKNWKRWGPYLSERQWGTVREDYSPDGSCWDYFSHDDSRSRAYRWGEDGLLGICDRQCRLCFSVALWNEKDPILKERLFGLTGPEGNHGEDVKENYYYLDSTPTHSYMKALYKYPQSEYPYSSLLDENRHRSLEMPEFELEDAGSFNGSKYWDVRAEYAKGEPQDILCKITVSNRGPDTATVHVLPTLWYRNTWIWGCTHEGCTLKPSIVKTSDHQVTCKHETLDTMIWEYDSVPGQPDPVMLFTENETNTEKLFNILNYTPYYKDAFHRYVVSGEKEAVSPKPKGTKVAAYYVLTVPPGESVILKSRLYKSSPTIEAGFGEDFEKIFKERIHDTEIFYKSKFPGFDKEHMNTLRQACAGLLWSKQFYHYIVADWLNGDADQIPPPRSRLTGRNHEWKHLFNRDVVSMPDKWEYPWYACWDLAFHMIPFCKIDPEFAKNQLLLFLREWYMSPSGQIPAYEFAFDDVNPPVHAWSVYRVYKLTAPKGQRDQVFLARCFQKLILNFTWWVNRKDPNGKNVFSGGFLGLDNIGVFDRSKPLPTGGELEQADGTAWMAFFCVVMLDIALELSLYDTAYQDMASKFFEHFIMIADAMNAAGNGEGLWDEKDGFYYDVLRFEDSSQPLRIRSMVGLIPLYACLVLDRENTEKMPEFMKRTHWFIKNRKDLNNRITFMSEDGSESTGDRILLAIPTKEQLLSVIKYLLDEDEFLSPYGIRSLSKVHKDHPFVMHVNGEEHRVDYVPGESNTYLFGGNSNWRGPVWLCVNYLIIESLERYDYFYGEKLKVECPTGSGNMLRLKDVAKEISRRIVSLFEPDASTGKRPCHGENEEYANDKFWKELILFYEYFHAESGRGCGASHQTGWTALVVNCLERICKSPH
ncbi:unnamed protein product [Clavelina lepadiformis]|uniref:Glycosyl hydrolase family 63 C-terminal domain-containing protein n=1 Tax=Clavelina lepadiformis TaxID=159417 RepID=A0ABP0FRF0_CLALP